MDFTELFQDLGIALGLGLLVGMQRERAASMLAGFRTFPLATVLGVLCAELGGRLGGAVVAAGLVALAGLIFAANQLRQGKAEVDPGLTTEVALLVMYGVGAYLVVGSEAVAVVVGGATAILLYLKPQLHAFARQLGEADFRAVMQFVLITLVILPVLPDRTCGPYGVWNPHRIWWLVVLITGISLGGYVAYKLWGNRVGVAVGGILGGLISSTATTVSYARRSAGSSEAGGATVVILLASAVVFGRVLGIAAAVSRPVFEAAVGPLGVMLATMGVLALLAWRRGAGETQPLPPHGNPSELRSALVFAALFALVLWATAAGREHFGERGLYGVAVLSGLTDMDAITLSTVQLVNRGEVGAEVGWRLILVAALANLAFKGGVVVFLGGTELRRRIARGFGVAGGMGLGLLVFWP